LGRKGRGNAGRKSAKSHFALNTLKNIFHGSNPAQQSLSYLLPNKETKKIIKLTRS
tara:strand:+ start:52 stop:219 length:168 start_codon:yes stop_codon:yes gene_type:complete